MSMAISARILQATFGTLVAVLAAVASAQAAPRVAVFELELHDSSLEGEINGVREDEQQRLAMSTEYLRAMLTEMGAEVVDMAAAQEELERVGPIRRCNGCERRIAEELGADYAVTGVVRKISNLILKFVIEVHDVESGDLVDIGATDIRGNTDKAWKRGVSFIVEHRLANSPMAVPAKETAQ